MDGGLFWAVVVVVIEVKRRVCGKVCASMTIFSLNRTNVLWVSFMGFFYELLISDIYVSTI